MREGTKCNKVYVVLSGEIEVFKTNLSNVYVNTDTGAVGIHEENAKR